MVEVEEEEDLFEEYGEEYGEERVVEQLLLQGREGEAVAVVEKAVDLWRTSEILERNLVE